jgi:hypothetical protein
MNRLVLVTLLTAAVGSPEVFRPCSEISRDLRFPCSCALGPVEAALDDNPSISVNCDRIVFPGDLPSLPYGAPIVAFSQRWAGHQALPTQVISQWYRRPQANTFTADFLFDGSPLEEHRPVGELAEEADRETPARIATDPGRA